MQATMVVSAETLRVRCLDVGIKQIGLYNEDVPGEVMLVISGDKDQLIKSLQDQLESLKDSKSMIWQCCEAPKEAAHG